MAIWSRIRHFSRSSKYRIYVLEKLAATAGIDLKKILSATGYGFEFLDRIELYKAWKEYLSTLPLENLTVLEISPREKSPWKSYGFKSYEHTDYPEFDICKEKVDRSFDLIIADNVFEHVDNPYSATKNVHAMLNGEGVFLIATPFLMQVHGAPYDYTRWTKNGLRKLLEEGGFQPEMISVRSWGNRKAIKASFHEPPKLGWRRDMRNEPEFPVMVWAMAKKQTISEGASGSYREQRLDIATE